MSEKTKIQWADATFNPWIGCTKVSPGCAHCYAENTIRARVLRSQNQETWGKGAKRSRTSAATWRNPIKWDSAAQACGHRPRVFPSLCDWLDEEVPILWLADFLRLIHATPNLAWLLLTKRPENFYPRMDKAGHLWACDGSYRETSASIVYHDLICPWRAGQPPANVWIGTSVENQAMADKRIPELLKIPARIRFLSVEPLLGPVDLHGLSTGGSIAGNRISWIIIGGESGPKARPCHLHWIRDVLQQGAHADVPCFMKQLGARPVQHGAAWEQDRQDAPFHLQHPKGGDPSEWPQDLRVRQFPSIPSTWKQ
jgi:protein gp37